jgi:septal ring factor EnvC (AmiA/AmiB activator)
VNINQPTAATWTPKPAERPAPADAACECCQADDPHECECQQYEAELAVLRQTVTRLHAEAAHLRASLAESERKLSEAAHERDQARRELAEDGERKPNEGNPCSGGQRSVSSIQPPSRSSVARPNGG